MTTRKRTSAAHVIAATFGSDAADVRDARYQPTRYAAPAVYVIGDSYFACWPTAPKHNFGGSWEHGPDQFFAAKAGTVLWVVKAAQEAGDR